MAVDALVGYGPTRRLQAFALACALFATAGCSKSYHVGDRVLVEWEGNDYPASVTAVETPGRLRVHYEGYDTMWDESVPATRIKGLVTGPTRNPPPPTKVRARASPSASALPSLYKAGDRVRVEWKGSWYPGSIVAVLGGERYRVHYDGYDQNWDENVDFNRIQRK